MKKLISSLFIFLVGATVSFGQAPAKSAPIVPGLELPADQTVDVGEGFVNIQAKTKGEVKWLVISNAKIKFIPYSQSIIVSVPPVNGQKIYIYANALVDGKITDFAQTTITISGAGPAPTPIPTPTPTPTPGPVGKGLHVTLFVDMDKVTPEWAQLLNSQTLRDGITQRNNFFRLYDIKSPIIGQKKLTTYVGGKGDFIMVVQKDNGQVLYSDALPKTEAEILKIIDSVR